MTRPSLNPSVSLYLDVSRIGAAVIVLLHHVLQPPFYSGTIHLPGRSAVIVFFVISGFVVAYATDGQRDWRSYAVARLARIYSVAIPALVLTGLLVLLVDVMWPGAAVERYDRPILRLLLSALFINQFWNLTVSTLSNGPYWSLCYEVWYYVLFGVCWFGYGWARWVAAILIVLLVGPRIVLLLPIWLIGASLYFAMKSRPVEGVPHSQGPFLGVLALFLLALLVANPVDALSLLVQHSLRDGYWKVGSLQVYIGGDWRFPSDYLLGLLFAATVWLSGNAFDTAAPTRALGRTIRWCSSYTFSLYLYHVPLLVFFHMALTAMLPGATPPWVMVALILLSVWVLGGVTERRKKPYTLLFRRLLGTGVSRG